MVQYQTLEDRGGIGYALANLASALYYSGKAELAIKMYEESLEIYKEYNSWEGIASLQCSIGYILMVEERFAYAKYMLEKALVTFQKIEEKFYISNILGSFAEIAVAEEQWEKATKLFGAEEALRETDNIPIPPLDMPRYEKAVKQLSQKLGEAVFIPTWREGGKMPLNEAIALALSE